MTGQTPAAHSQAENAPLLVFIRVMRGRYQEAFDLARALHIRAQEAQNEKGGRTPYVRELEDQARNVMAAAAQIGQAIRRILKEKEAEIRRLTNPRNGNAAHEVAVDITSALRDDHNIHRGQ